MFTKIAGHLTPVLILSFFMIQCGTDANFNGGNFKVLPDKDNDSNLSGDPNKHDGDLDGTTVLENDQLNWLWSCNGNDVAFDKNDEDSYVMNEGPHAINSDGNNFNLNVKGELCLSGKMNRDIIFVVDLSSSMVNNDPVSNNQCGRMAAINAVIDSVSDPDRLRVGLITFDSKRLTKVDLTSTSDLLSNNVNRNTLCKSRLIGSSTSYRAGLSEVKAMIDDKGRDGALKEVYFVSDGLGRNDKDGADEAAEIRQAGVTVATLMLKGNDSTLKESIASKDNKGKPLHSKINNASQLANSLENLATARLVGAKAYSRATGTKDWTEERIFKNDQIRSSFAIDLGVIRPQEAEDGFQFKFIYNDNHGNKFTREGDLYWEN